MLFSDANIFTPDGYIRGGFRIENGRFSEILPGLSHGGIRLDGAKVLPGLIDLHIHGSAGADASDGDPDGLTEMSAYLIRHGITSFVPTLMTLPYETLSKALQSGKTLWQSRPENGARILGFRMEGPFLSDKRRGAQNPLYLRNPDFSAFLSLYEASGSSLCMVDIAPELPDALSFIEQAKSFCTVSLAHTDADYETALQAFRTGAGQLTHTFNAMSPLHHRAPGVIGAAFTDSRVTVEAISDGYHLHPTIVPMLFRLFPGRVCLISDALRCCGLEEGTYQLGGQTVRLSGGVARLLDGTIAGAASDLFTDLKNAVHFGVPEAEAIMAATLVPARALKKADLIGSISVGCYADFLICDDDLSLHAVYADGTRMAW